MQIMSDKINTLATSPSFNHHSVHKIRDLVGSRAALDMVTDSKVTACVQEYKQTFQILLVLPYFQLLLHKESLITMDCAFISFPP
jgi:hypothetical protein